MPQQNDSITAEAPTALQAQSASAEREEKAIRKVAKKRRRARKRRAAWLVSILTAVAATVAAIGAVVATIYVGNIGADAIRDSDVRSARADAYAAYVEAHSLFNEFIFGETYWLPDFETSLSDEQETAFWTEAAQIQADLATTYLRARMVADEGTAAQELSELQKSQSDTFHSFKCMTGAQDDCGEGEHLVERAGREQILKLLSDWNDASTLNMDQFTDAAADQLR